jgi:two-component sensor histidine kinase
MSLSSVLHEMATNAAKYGALSVPSGHLQISWRVEDATNQLRLHWVESGGPAVTIPATTGFGTTLIESTITYSLGGQLEQEYAPEGFRAEIMIPLGSYAPPA